jgi:hypothetical protein
MTRTSLALVDVILVLHWETTPRLLRCAKASLRGKCPATAMTSLRFLRFREHRYK